MPDTLTPAPAARPVHPRAEDDVDDVENHAVWCHCDECDPDRHHDVREAA